MNDQSLVKMPDGTIKKFFGRKHKALAKKFVENHDGSKALVIAPKAKQFTKHLKPKQ